MKNSVKIFMCCHKPYDILPPLTVPVMGGATNENLIDGCLADSGPGGSISHLNAEYCELTVQYYAWKNQDADYYGFCHYRRFFGIAAKTKQPYLCFGKPSRKKLSGLLGTEGELYNACQGAAAILPRAEDVGLSVYEKYITSPYCHKEDLDLFISLIKEKYPTLSEATNRYMAGRNQYFCNMFIMKRDLFFEYCDLLFPLLFEFDKRKVRHGSFQDDRTDGYLAERFLGIFVSELYNRGLKITEVPRIDTECDLKKRIICKLFPAGIKAAALYEIQDDNKNRR